MELFCANLIYDEYQYREYKKSEKIVAFGDQTRTTRYSILQQSTIYTCVLCLCMCVSYALSKMSHIKRHTYTQTHQMSGASFIRSKGDACCHIISGHFPFLSLPLRVTLMFGTSVFSLYLAVARVVPLHKIIYVHHNYSTVFRIRTVRRCSLSLLFICYISRRPSSHCIILIFMCT